MCLSNWRHGYKLRGLGLTTVGLLVCLWSVAALAQPITFDTIALTDTDGAFGPGLGPGVMYSGLGGAVTNNSGRFAFSASLTGTGVVDDGGVFIGGDAPLTIVARNGTDGPLGPGLGSGITFSSVGPLLNEAGELLLRSGIAGFTSLEHGLWRLDPDAGTGPQAVLRTGTDGPLGPGLAPGVEFEPPPFGVDFDTVSFNSSGDVVVDAYITDFQNDQGIWLDNGTGPMAVALAGTDGPLGPGLGPGVQFGSLDGVQINEARQVVFAGQFTDPAQQQGVWLLDESGKTLLARSGTDGPLGPGLGPGESFSGLGTGDFADNGIVATVASLNVFSSSAERTIAVISPAGIDIVAMTSTEGPLGPGVPGHRFDSLGQTRQFADGNLVFHGRVDPAFDFNFGDEQNTGLWLIEEGGPPQPLLLADTETGFGPGIEVQGVGNTLRTNHRGDVVAQVRLVGPGVIQQVTDRALIALVDGEQLPIVREGDLIDVDSSPAEDLRTVSLFRHSDDPLDDNGLYYLNLRFTDGSEGIFTAQLPVPVPGDFNGDGIVDGTDFLLWQLDPSVGSLADWEANYGTSNSQLAGDFDLNGEVNGLDFLLWQQDPSVGSLADWEANYGMVATLSASSATVPEPTTCTLALAALCLAMSRRRTF